MRNSPPRLALTLVSALFTAAVAVLSWWRWWTFQYHTFDLAFYVQSLWLAIRGQWNVSLLDVPMLGNHAEPIVFLLAPLFALFPHPMLFVVVQALAFATMPYTAWRIAERLGIRGWPAASLAAVTLVCPAAGFIALHEFHPEAFAAPLLLLAIEARISGRLRLFWLWFVLCVACKENVALLMVGWGMVHAWCDRGKPIGWQWRWNAAPALIAAAWLGVYAFWLSPKLNGGRVDYGNLYSHLGASGGEMLSNLFLEPGRAGAALWGAVTHGNLVWSLLASFALLPLFRPRWLLIALPLVLQHLLSSRSSEWTIYFHYAAPLLPLLWIASAEAIVRFQKAPALASLPFAASLILQVAIGPFRAVGQDFGTAGARLWQRQWKAEMLQRVPVDPSVSVCAGIPYLAHLAARRQLYSLHFVLKGLKTLSASRFVPEYAPDVVFIDFGDQDTFSVAARFYHPAGNNGSETIPSSDELLNAFLTRQTWSSDSLNTVTLLKPGQADPFTPEASAGLMIDPQSMLTSIALAQQPGQRAVQIRMEWVFAAPRTRIPWFSLLLQNASGSHSIPVGMCMPQMAPGSARESRRVLIPAELSAGDYQASAVFHDELQAKWLPSEHPILKVVPLGPLPIVDPRAP